MLDAFLAISALCESTLSMLDMEDSKAKESMFEVNGSCGMISTGEYCKYVFKYFANHRAAVQPA